MLGNPRRKAVAAPLEPPPDVREALARLQRLVEVRPELAAPAALYMELLPALFGSLAPAQAIALDAERIAAKLAAGTPILRGEPLPLDPVDLRSQWQHVCDVLRRHRDPIQPGLLAEAVHAAKIDPLAALRSVLDAGPAEFRRLVDLQGLEVALGDSVLRLVALPRLAPIAASLESAWRRAGWSHGSCPVCGSWPLVAEFRGLEQFRWLRCGLCASGWQVDRQFCPFCENRDHRTLRDLFVEGEQHGRRVSVCDSCRGFVRAVSTLTPLTPPGLLVAELETMHLEPIARDRGYTSGDCGI